MFRHLVSLCCFLLLGLSAPAHAGFPEITDAERALTAVEGSPEAPAVVLFEKADLTLMDPVGQQPVSVLRVERRVKVLDPRGVDDYGEISIHHSRRVRLSNLEGRTVLPDGREVRLPKDAVFERRSSRSEKQFETVAAFSSVEPGAILDYSYDLRWDSLYYLQPWVFQSEIPTLHSEIVYHVSHNIAVSDWGRTLKGRQLQNEVRPERNGRRIRVWLTDLPAIPDEPYGAPPLDLAAQFMLIPTAVGRANQQTPLLQNWATLAEMVDLSLYQPALTKDAGVKKKTQELTAGLTGEQAKAEALFGFVRDEIDGFDTYSVLSVSDQGVESVLRDGEGSATEQSLLLYRMLDLAGLEPRLVWAPERADGRVDMTVANPDWFERTLVRLDLAVEGAPEDVTVYLDPSGRSLAFGALRPGNEGQPALLVHRRKPEVIELPAASYVANGRRARVDLTVGDDGRLAGSGTLTYTGHDAARAVGDAFDPATAEDEWTEILEDRFAGYTVTAVSLDPAIDQRRLVVTFDLAQEEAEVLGDEATVVPTRPLGPRSQVFDLPPERRKTPVLLPFASWDEVETRITWPAGWSVAQTPEPVEARNAAGAVELTVERDDAARSLTVRRQLDVQKTYFAKDTDYGALRDLYSTLEKHDAQPVFLVRD